VHSSSLTKKRYSVLRLFEKRRDDVFYGSSRKERYYVLWLFDKEEMLYAMAPPERKILCSIALRQRTNTYSMAFRERKNAVFYASSKIKKS
jgi:hypothetical protein